MTKCFYETFFNIAKFLEKTASRSADIKNICPGVKGCAHSPLPPFIVERNGYVRNRASYNTFKLLKWAGIFQGGGIHQGGVTWVEIFQGGRFS